MLVDPYKLGKSDGRSLGRKDGIRASVTWLLNRAREMNDPQAKAILNSTAYNLGQDLKYRESELVALEHVDWFEVAGEQGHRAQIAESQLAEADALIANHANSIDNSHPSTWPEGSRLAAAIKRHGIRCALELSRRAHDTISAQVVLSK